MEINDLSTVTIILRGFELDKVEAVAQAMENTKIKNIEVTTNSPNYLNTISKIKNKYPNSPTTKIIKYYLENYKNDDINDMLADKNIEIYNRGE